MKKERFKYDVAFSFLAKDEQTAIKIDNLLKNRLNTFLFSKKQEEIAGTDGEETFHNVFGKESRIVVILFRENWGSTRWTRIEETAIKNRGYEEGYDFTFFIPIDTSFAAPQWLPKNRIWFDLERWGVEGAASAIEVRVQEAGREPHEESITDRAVRIKRLREFQEKREKFLHSEEGVAKAREEIKRLFDIIKEQVIEINKKSIPIKAEEEKSGTPNEKSLFISSGGYWIALDWWIRYRNSLSDSHLILSVHRGDPRSYHPKVGTTLSEEVFNFDIDTSENPRWKSEHSGKDFSTRKLAEYCIGLLIDRVEQDSMHK
jgi:hypothetical protein